MRPSKADTPPAAAGQQPRENRRIARNRQEKPVWIGDVAGAVEHHVRQQGVLRSQLIRRHLPQVNQHARMLPFVGGQLRFHPPRRAAGTVEHPHAQERPIIPRKPRNRAILPVQIKRQHTRQNQQKHRQRADDDFLPHVRPSMGQRMRIFSPGCLAILVGSWYDKKSLSSRGEESMGRLYRCLRAVVRAVTPRMTTTWEEPFSGNPSVFVCNHVGAFGPIDMVVKFPLRDEVRVWCNEGIMNRKTCPAYVRQDYWWKPGCRLEPLYNATLPYIAAAVLPPILQSAPTIPVYHDARVMTTMRQSMKALKEGKHLVIFPEQPSGFGEHHNWINTGWLNICTMFYRATGKNLTLYPVHIDQKKHCFEVQKPVMFDGNRTLEEQQDALVKHLAAGLRGQHIKE